MKHHTLSVHGMTCEGCAESINKSVNQISGVKNISVDLDGKKVSVDYDELLVELDIIKDKIISLGFNILN